jgi:hypothetical protein
MDTPMKGGGSSIGNKKKNKYTLKLHTGTNSNTHLPMMNNVTSHAVLPANGILEENI